MQGIANIFSVLTRRISHKVISKEEVWSANVFINEGYWRPEWWERS